MSNLLVRDSDHMRPIEHGFDVRQMLAVANRILARQKVVDAFGHVSQRSPDQHDRFFIARSMAPGRVKPADIIELDLAGNSVNPDSPKSYLERFIHAEIYRTRPDVMAIVHSHSPALLPFSIARNTTFRCVCHTAGFIGDTTPIFEIRDVAGDDTDLLISNPDLGAALARTLGERDLVLMRGHGSTTVGRSLQQAVFHAIYTEVNARILAEALRLGDVNYMTSGEARNTTASPDGVARAWDIWAAEVALELEDQPR